MTTHVMFRNPFLYLSVVSYYAAYAVLNTFSAYMFFSTPISLG